MAGLTIGAFAKAVGVRPDTIRYYERNGLLPHPARSSAGYRLYAESDLERVRFIRKAQQLGLVTVLCRSPISLSHLGFEGERADAAQI